MIILDHLLHIERLETSKEKSDYAIGLYMTNSKFADYADLAYKRSLTTYYIDLIKEFPTFKQDNVPYGYNIQTLEHCSKKIKQLFFFSDTETPQLTEEQSDIKLAQYFESLSDVENRFLMAVLRKNISYIIDRDEWKVAKHS